MNGSVEQIIEIERSHNGIVMGVEEERENEGSPIAFEPL